MRERVCAYLFGRRCDRRESGLITEGISRKAGQEGAL